MSVSVLATPPVTISRSKIERPVLAGQWVRRPRLESRFDRTLTRSLVVVTAPAGHGKTSTIASWLHTRGLDAAWVTVDSRDAELTTFAAHVTAALERVAPGIDAALFALLTTPDRLAPHHLGDAFADALYDLDRDVILVLDDFHAVGDGPAAEFVAGLVHAAPRRLHTILSSRGKPPFPLSRLRTRGDVEELTGADFRFSPQETRDLLHLETGDVINPEMAASVQASVGGWPAAIRLIAISRGSSDALLPPETISNSQEHLLLDYLGEEVLARLPTHHRDLLLRASLLERFNALLLEALATGAGGRQISRAEIEQLRALELFREIPGLSETWFAYHPVFQHVLRRELERTTDAQAIADLRRGAARWFAQEGFTREAVRHFVAAGDVPAAATLVESSVLAAFAAEDWQSIAAWLPLIPMEESRQRPELLLASAWVAYLGGRGSLVADVLERLRDPRFRRLATDAQRAEIALIADWPDDDPDQWVALTERAIGSMHPDKRYRLGFAHMMLALALTCAGREEEALARLAAFTERESARIDAASIRGYFGRVVVLWQSGRLTQCERTAADQLQLAQMNGLPLSAGWGSAFLGVIAHERGHLAEANRHFETVFAGADRLHIDCVRESFFAQILAYEAHGRQDEADRAVVRLREVAIAAETLHQLELVDSFVARTALIRGDLATAQRWLGASSPALRQADLKVIEHPLLTRVKILVAVGTGETLAEADRLLAEFVSYARAMHMTLALLEGLAVLALLHEARGERTAAARILKESLVMAAPEGIVQRYAYLGPSLAPILDRILAERAPVPHARSVRDALEAVLAAQPAATRAFGVIPPDLSHNHLTEREMDVMHLLARRLTNIEIGEELFISPVTVKNHIAHITDKLGVSGRRAAVERAGELGLFHAAS